MNLWVRGENESSLQLWLKADSGLDEIDGQNIDIWTDQAGSNVFPNFGDPSFEANGINFNPSVDFDGSDYFKLAGNVFNGDFST